MPGATVLYNKFCNGFTSATGEELLILGVEDIVAVL
jgi:co-chaperonin GroES (HSP10)